VEEGVTVAYLVFDETKDPSMLGQELSVVFFVFAGYLEPTHLPKLFRDGRPSG